MQEIVRLIANYTATVAEAIAVLFIIFGIVGAVFMYINKATLFHQNYRAMSDSRTHLGHTLSVALEFLIGADILKTAISPTWKDIELAAY